jgi:AcrR family transcriptional regulator
MSQSSTPGSYAAADDSATLKSHVEADEDARLLPKTLRGQKTRAKILDAAEAEFGERGFHEASINGITARAGVALGSFYTYFPSKEALFRALVDHMGRLTRRYIAERVAAAPDRMNAERSGLEAFITFTRDHRNLYRIIMEAQFVAADAYRAYYESFAHAYRDNLVAAAERGHVREGDAEVRAWALIGMNVFLGLRYGVWSDDREPRQIAEEVVMLLQHGLAPTSI